MANTLSTMIERLSSGERRSRLSAISRLRTSRHLRIVVGTCGALVTGMVMFMLTVPVRTQSVTPVESRLPTFLQADRCYRLTFPIAGSPNWKVLEVLEGGWVRAEVDAGSTSARREALWINTAQIVTVREARCAAY